MNTRTHTIPLFALSSKTASRCVIYFSNKIANILRIFWKNIELYFPMLKLSKPFPGTTKYVFTLNIVTSPSGSYKCVLIRYSPDGIRSLNINSLIFQLLTETFCINGQEWLTLEFDKNGSAMVFKYGEMLVLP